MIITFASLSGTLRKNKILQLLVISGLRKEPSSPSRLHGEKAAKDHTVYTI